MKYNIMTLAWFSILRQKKNDLSFTVIRNKA